MRKEIRVWFSKKGASRFISHLDLNRCMSRAIHRAKLPVWYTEGYNPHVFLSFAAPLSLGFEGERESMDIRLIEEMPYDLLLERLNAGLPPDIRAYEVTEPVMKPGEIAFAEYHIVFSGGDPEGTSEALWRILHNDALIVEKKTKKGAQQVNILPYFKNAGILVLGGGVMMDVTLPAGSEGSVNPSLFLEAVEPHLGASVLAKVQRLRLLDREKREFR